MPRVRWRRSQRTDRDNHSQPSIGALSIALAPHLLDPLARLGRGVLATVLYGRNARWRLRVTKIGEASRERRGLL